MADVLSNQLKAVFALGNFTDEVVLYKQMCSTICQFDYACKRDVDEAGRQTGITNTTVMTVALKSATVDKYKELYKALKSTQISCFSVLFNAVFDQDNQLSDYYGGMVVDGYVVDIEESFDVASLNPNGMSLTVKIVVNTIKYVGRQTTKELQLNFA
ncbi:MAG: hypothetical protein II215_04980 [Paludibacteraceae bacterium]|nr:hypothetical protein [Paludibacteraceae bacterium]